MTDTTAEAPKPPTNAELLIKITAVRYWLLQLFALQAGHAPEIMAWRIRRKVEAMANWSPPDDGSMPAADFDKTWLQIVPEMQDLGRAIADDLDGLAKAMRAGEVDEA